MIIIKEVKTRKEINDFIKFPLKLYKGVKEYVPCLRSSEKALFKRKNPFTSSCDTIYFNAYIDNKMVGRISGIIQRDANTKWGQKRVRFTRFDSIDDCNVSSALFDGVCKWAKDKGMDEIVGPLGFNDLEREGLLIEGFDKMSTFEEQYNFPYYQKLIEDYGFIKEVDWLEQEIRLPKEGKEKFEKVCDYMLKKFNLHMVHEKNLKTLIKNHIDDFFLLLDDTYSDIYGTAPLREEVKKDLLKGFKLLLKEEDIVVINNDKGEMVCFALLFPSIAEAISKCKGRLTPIGIIRLLHAINKPKVKDFGLIGVRKDYRNLGVPSLVLKEVMIMLESGKYDHFETNLTLETNYQILGILSRFDTVIHKKRRSFIKKI